VAEFYGRRLHIKQKLNRTVVDWLEKLPETFSVLVDLEGSDFVADFVVIKERCIFNIEAEDWQVREADPYRPEWELRNGERRKNPFPSLLDQCQRFADYIVVQRSDIFASGKAATVWNNRKALRVFPVLALTQPSPFLHFGKTSTMRIFLDSKHLRQHLERHEWFPKERAIFSLTSPEIRKLASLFGLEEIDPKTLLPKHPKLAQPIPTLNSSIVRCPEG
jgi:hypothetical protein